MIYTCELISQTSFDQTLIGLHKVQYESLRVRKLVSEEPLIIEILKRSLLSTYLTKVRSRSCWYGERSNCSLNKKIHAVQYEKIPEMESTSLSGVSNKGEGGQLPDADLVVIEISSLICTEKDL
ncbi:unnamed protein product [Moneuplotes crassus]|uniref:Uncharacterized protein n=1 Tax=Euplotes crassus TaxID=5936 RepID=A0AAD1XCY4_EUPCR|nr:unnamed protein product [Moneuplotes crassus]